jgi:hypothetical protein
MLIAKKPSPAQDEVLSPHGRKQLGGEACGVSFKVAFLEAAGVGTLLL